MSIRSWWASLRRRSEEKAAASGNETAAASPEEQRFSSVDIAGHSAAKEAQRLSDDR
jgi:head-tail adaptor